jgi:hypothetical protein
MARTMVLFELEKQCHLTCNGNVGLGDVLRACFKGERLCAAFLLANTREVFRPRRRSHSLTPRLSSYVQASAPNVDGRRVRDFVHVDARPILAFVWMHTISHLCPLLLSNEIKM